ncbi:MAG: GNAT family N-acetyltransferase [Nocardiopsaceae bacterium]|nr:GNAT family N-acetyltransferase [Nocardiopsaceae bacterium]
MTVVREVGPGDWAVMRDVRLAALAEAPHAFESTYEREAGFTEERWRTRINDRSVNYLAYDEADPGEPVGLAGVFVPDGAAELVSMWVRPSARGRKVGETLITACADWARSRGHDELFLWVFEPNTPARRLYERRGFLPTGERQPLPANPAAIEIKMRLAL